MSAEVRPSQYTVTEGHTLLFIKTVGEFWVVEWSAMNTALFPTLEEATAAARRWIIPLEKARAMREEATQMERAVIDEMSLTPHPAAVKS